jgi:hypothetical protein
LKLKLQLFYRNKPSKFRDDSSNNKSLSHNYLNEQKNYYTHETLENNENPSKSNKLKYFLDEIKRDKNESRENYNYTYKKQLNQKDYLSFSNKNIPKRDNRHSSNNSNYMQERDLKSKSPINDFSQFRNELTHLQCNIDKLERKLCKFKKEIIFLNFLVDNASISVTSPLSSMSTNLKSHLNTNFQTADSNIYNYPLQDKNVNLPKAQIKQHDYKEGTMDKGILNYTKNILERRAFSPSRNDDYQNYQEQEDHPEEYKSVSFKNVISDEGKQENFEKFNTLPREENNTYSNYYHNRNESINSINVLSSVQSNNMNSYRGNESRYQEKQHLVEELRSEIVNLEGHNRTYERECHVLKIKNDELLKELRDLKKVKEDPEKNLEYKAKFQFLSREYESLSSQYEKSERIRDEQNSLIRSLQREIDILRDTYIKEKISVNSYKEKKSRDVSFDRKSDDKDRSIENPFINNKNQEEKSKSKKKKNKSSEKIRKTSKSKTSKKAPKDLFKEKSTQKGILENNMKPIPLDKKKKNNSIKSRGNSPLPVPSKRK